MPQGTQDKQRDHSALPLAVRVRPVTPDQILGQNHLLQTGAPLLRVINAETNLSSIILYGPPGTGKTTLAKMIALNQKTNFVELSATSSNLAALRAVIQEANLIKTQQNISTTLFIDEIHRFSKTQQDALLPVLEDQDITLIAATTENPAFSIIKPLLSRSLLLTLNPISDEDITLLIQSALKSENGLNNAYTINEQALDSLTRLAGNDARRALTYLEAAAYATGPDHLITPQTLEKAVDRYVQTYDKKGDTHYDTISAFIKSVRGSDPDAALFYLAKMIESGEDPKFISRRIIILAAEDIGLADPQALILANAAAQATASIGLPEARIILSQAVIYLALAPKSNAAYLAIDEALADVRLGGVSHIPAYLKDQHSGSLRNLPKDKRQSYIYPHDTEASIAPQQYLPNSHKDRIYYRPTQKGFEQKLTAVLSTIKKILKG